MDGAALILGHTGPRFRDTRTVSGGRFIEKESHKKKQHFEHS